LIAKKENDFGNFRLFGLLPFRLLFHISLDIDNTDKNLKSIHFLFLLPTFLVHNSAMNNLLMPNMIVLAIELIFLILVYLGLFLSLHFLEKKIKVAVMQKQMSQHILSGVKMIRRAFNLLFIGIFLGVIGFNSWKIYQGIDLQQDTLVLFSRISPDFWANLIQNTGISIAVFFIARYLIGLIDKGLIKLRTVVLNYKNIQSNNESINIFFQRLSRMQGAVIGILVVYGLSRQFGLPGSILAYLIIALNIYLVISISLLFVSAVAVVVESLDALSKYYADSRGLMVFYNRLKHLVPLLRRTLDYIIYVAVATLVITQLEFIAEFARYGPGIIQGIGVFFLSRVGVEVINLLIDRTAIHGDLSEKECQRNQTIAVSHGERTRRLIVPGSGQAALFTRRAIAPEGKQSRHTKNRVQSFEVVLRSLRRVYDGVAERHGRRTAGAPKALALSFCRLLGLGCPKQAFAKIATPRLSDN
jgi:moderate conductance mechanosensitive channel